MAKSQQTYNKSEKEKKRRKKKQDKAEKRLQRKLEREEKGPVAFEDLIRYVDEDGNLSTTPPDPTKKKKIKAEDIQLGVPVRTSEPGEQYRKGKVKFFNHEKGFGFITDSKTQDSIFVFISNAYQEIKENDKVSFETEKGPKGPVAVNVRLDIDKPKPPPVPPAAPKPEGSDSEEEE